jgi:hypothetical protein
MTTIVKNTLPLKIVSYIIPPNNKAQLPPMK